MANLSGIKNIKIYTSSTAPSNPQTGDVWLIYNKRYQYTSQGEWKDIFTNEVYVYPGTLWAWGDGDYGKLGLNVYSSHRSSPTQVGAIADWTSVSAGGYHSVAVRWDGTLWAWGYNTSGQLGLGDVITRSSPVQVGALSSWKKVSCGSSHTIGLQTNGTLWAWGYNSSGQLGIGYGYRSSPTQIGNLTTWTENFATNFNTCMAIQTDGTLWAWGNNTTGQLGDGTNNARNSPVLVSGTWKSITTGTIASFGVKTDGTLWNWGQLYGPIYRSYPVQLGTDTDWFQVDCQYGSQFALKTNRTLWTWGYNVYGQQGHGDTTIRTTPTQLGTETYLDFNISTENALAIRANGTLWSWGRNDTAQLGLNDRNIHRSSPVQVGNLTNWKSIAINTTFCLAIKST